MAFTHTKIPYNPYFNIRFFLRSTDTETKSCGLTKKSTLIKSLVIFLKSVIDANSLKSTTSSSEIQDEANPINADIGRIRNNDLLTSERLNNVR